MYRYLGRDGTELAWHSSGPVDGRPLVLVHGLFGSGARLADSPPVRALAGRGYRVILPDLRGHGDSGRPHDPACYPPDVVADDLLALVDELGLDDYDLAGYSLGGKMVLRLLARGARPARAVVGGQGVDALDAASSRTDGYRRLLAAAGRGEPLAPGSPDEAMGRGAALSGVDPLAVSHLLGSMVATPRGALSQVRLPVLVMVGADDSRGASAGELAQLLPDARLVRVPGSHETAFETDAFTAALLEFLAGSLGAPVRLSSLVVPRLVVVGHAGLPVAVHVDPGAARAGAARTTATRTAVAMRAAARTGVPPPRMRRPTEPDHDHGGLLA